jgi:hypothetical protein
MELGTAEHDVSERDFLPLAEVISRAGVSDKTFARCLRAAGVQLWRHPFDGRKRMVRRDDFARLLHRLQPVVSEDAA